MIRETLKSIDDFKKIFGMVIRSAKLLNISKTYYSKSLTSCCITVIFIKTDWKSKLQP